MAESVLQIVVIVFMMFLCALCLFAVVVIVRDIVHESAETRRLRIREAKDEAKKVVDTRAEVPEPVAEKVEVPVVEEPKVCKTEEKAEPVEDGEALAAEKTAEDVTATAVSEEPVEETVEETVAETAEAEIAATEVDENAVSFSRVSLTIEEKYATFSTEYKRFFDDIIKHTLSKEGVKEFKKPSSYDYKIGAYKVLRLTIKRGEITCEFHFIDNDFNTYAGESDVKIKQSATVVRVLEPSAVGVVKDGVDLVCKQIAEDKERKKALALAKRREKRRLAKGGTTATEKEHSEKSIDPTIESTVTTTAEEREG